MKKYKSFVITLLTVILLIFTLTGCSAKCETCNDTHKIKCQSCLGVGNSICQFCGGLGRTYDVVTHTYTTCFFCVGMGRSTCIECGATGKLDCPDCT